MKMETNDDSSGEIKTEEEVKAELICKDSAEVKGTPEDNEEEPNLKRPAFNFAYVSCFRLKTVIVEPFSPELFQDGCLQNWLAQSEEFDIRKDRAGKSVVVMHFETEDIGEAAFLDLKETLEKEHSDIKVSHPYLVSVNACSCRDVVEMTLNLRHTDDKFLHLRQVILEGVPDSIPLDKILQIFPDAKNILDFRDDPISSGIITFEVSSVERLGEIVGAGKDLKIDDHTVRIGKYATRANNWNRKNVKKAKKDRESREADGEPLSDEERIELCKVYNDLRQQIKAVFDRTDIFSQEKKAESRRLNSLLKPMHVQLDCDTQRRFKRGDKTLPEPEEHAITKSQVRKRERQDVRTEDPILPVAVVTDEKVFSKMAEREALLEKAKKEAAERNRKATEALMIKAKAEAFNEKRGGTRGGGLRGGIPRGGAPRGGFNRGGAPMNRARGAPIRGRGGRGGVHPGRGGPAASGPSRGGPNRGGPGRGRGGRGFGRGRGFDESNTFSFGGGRGGFGRGSMHDDFHDDDYGPVHKRMRGDFGGGPDRRTGGHPRGAFRGNFREPPSTMGADPIEERLQRLEQMQMASLEVQSKMLETRRF